MSNYSSKQLFIGGLLAPLAFGLLIGVLFLAKNNIFALLPVKAEEQHLQGNKDAKVKIVEYSDFQCPFCERAYPILKQVIKDYGDKISFEYKHFPLSSIHPFAQKAAEASECAAEQGKFWQFHDKDYENQQNLSLPALKEWAGEIGLNTATFNSCLDSGKYAGKVQVDLQAGQKLGVNGTPTTFINGQSVVGAQPYEAFKTIIDAELKK
jgi:protein-disulfide isomerase